MSPRPALVLAGVTLAVTLLAAWLVYGTVSGEALLGFDGYPLIAASAFHSIVDPLAVFGDELMGGRYPDGRFYRPIVHLTFGVDHALGGLDPAQYARTDIALAALTSTFLGLLASALAGARGWTAAAVTACAAATFRSTTTTRAPADANFSQIARPMPLAPPVTTQTFPAKSMEGHGGRWDRKETEKEGRERDELSFPPLLLLAPRSGRTPPWPSRDPREHWTAATRAPVDGAAGTRSGLLRVGRRTVHNATAPRQHYAGW